MLLDHDTRRLLKVDGLHLVPRLLPAARLGLPSVALDEFSFVVQRASHISAEEGAVPLQPRELVTLQHVASGCFLADLGGSAGNVGLLPYAGAGTAWEIGRALAALGAAPLQVGELVHVRSCAPAS